MGEYEEHVASLAERANAAAPESLDWYESLGHDGDEMFLGAVQALSSSGRELIDVGYLAVRLFPSWDDDRRLLAMTVVFDVQTEAALLRTRLRFAPYAPQQQLFTACQNLLGHVEHEMIPWSVITSVRDDGIVGLDGVYGQLDSYISPGVIEWLRAEARPEATWVRLHPCSAWPAPPPRLLEEAVIRPANPRWWSSLTLRTREHDGGRYEVQAPSSPVEDLNQYWEYHVQGLRRLEFRAARRRDDYVTMMLEELQNDPAMGSLVGRCVHWDSCAPSGTPIASAALGHLDIAVNVYAGDARASRLGDDLSKGKVTDASFRTHLVRVNGGMVSSMVGLATAFLQSSTLKNDWIGDHLARAS